MAKKAALNTTADNVINLHATAQPADLASKMMLAGLSISVWTNRKEEKRITNDAAVEYRADADRLRATKNLIDPKALHPVQQAATRIRETHRKLTAPWLDNGQRILSVQMFPRYSAEMQAAREDFDSAVTDFLTQYPRLAEDSRAALGDLFTESDYPDEKKIAGKFGTDTSLSPVPTGKDFRVGLSDQEAKRIAAEIDDRLKNGVQAAMADTWQQVATAVRHMAGKLKEYEPGEDGKRAKGIFRDSLVDNLAELVDLLPGLNLTGDPELARATEAIRAELVDGLTADDLREDETLRRDTAQAAEDILAQFAGYMSSDTE